ncbi:sulfatase [Aliifodinibius sp. S!AR15-10]|uniref:sulfatase family protein n=1 Tax=Aliifodinibius sp. S!AR15-10 TaxID=2950437 RepID=UPI00285D8AF7|nr:sulfatase [Aliifodinibius sp. S!AR15-10]MDR8390183.1 sulfatase [Aliifodinibius sp. S!AR15-10]
MLNPTTGSGQVEALETRPNILFVISDDQSWPHAGAYGPREIATPAFDRVAKDGVLFSNAFAAAPQCSPNRAAILTGRNIWQLEEAGTHASNFPKKFQVFPDLLEKAGYQVGYTGKGWGPGNWEFNGWQRNPVGNEYSDKTISRKPFSSVSDVDYSANFQDFLANRDKGKPFFFWVGAYEPHRTYEEGAGIAAGKNPGNVEVPPFLPDTPGIRSDLLDYYLEIEWFDEQLGRMLSLLEKNSQLDHTLVVVTSDNGMPFPRAKANLYEFGTHIPLAIRWPSQIPGGRVVEDLVSSIDFFPTFMDIVGTEIPKQVSGRSLLQILLSDEEGIVDSKRDVVLTGRERHTHARPDNLGYPSRSIRTQEYLYIRNFRPDRWPAGNPRPENRDDMTTGDFKSFGRGYADIDGSPTKTWMLENREEPDAKRLFHLAFEKRPAEELYNIQKDSACLNNLAGLPRHAAVQTELSTKLDSILTAQNDPRAFGFQIFESYPRYSPMRNFPGFNERGAYNFDF